MRDCQLGWCQPGAVIEVNGLNAVVVGADLSQEHWMMLQRVGGHRASFSYETPVKVIIEPIQAGIVALQMLEATRSRGESWPPPEPARTSLPAPKEYLREPTPPMVSFRPRRKRFDPEDLL